MGVDWRGLAIKLPQNYTKKTACKLAHSQAYVCALRQGSPTCARPRLGRYHGRPCAYARNKDLTRSSCSIPLSPKTGCPYPSLRGILGSRQVK